MPTALLPDHAVPVLETARLRLRRHRADDLAPCVAMWADPEVVRHIGGRPFTAEETWQKLLRYAGLWALLGYGYWVIEDKATGGFLGELGFADFHREIAPPIAGMPELGWVLAPHAHGRGYATEAARAVLAWGDAHLGGAQTVCIIAPDNAASVRVAEKCGYRLLTRTTYKGEPTAMFTR